MIFTLRRDVSLFFLLFGNLAWIATSNSALAKGARRPAQSPANAALTGEVTDLKTRLSTLEKSVQELDSEIEVIKAQSKMMIQRTSLGFLNQTYLKGGFSLLLPRSRTFDFNTDTGLGLFAGIGQYFGRNHVIDLSFEWDIYPSLSVRYRYEIHRESPALSFGPVVGYKVRAVDARPLDNFLARPEEVSTSFFILGGIASFHMNRSVVFLELVYLFNRQAFLTANAGVHFFF